MKYLKKIRMSFLILSVIIAALGQTVFAADEEYTYTVRLYAGNLGTLTGAGISAPGGDIKMVSDKEIVITGLKYHSPIEIDAQEAANLTDNRYYVKGVRKSGSDNSDARDTSRLFEPNVKGDKSYVIAYGIKGKQVSYTVNYLDANGNRMLESDTGYGNSGDRQYVSARNIDGYIPQAYNLVKTLSDNEAENVFNFQYRPATPAETETATGTETATPGGAGTEGGGTAAEGEEGAGEEGAANAGEQDVTQVPDENTPQDLVDLDEEDTPLANKILDERPGTRLGYFPMYVTIALAALAALILAVIYLKKRQGSAVQTEEIVSEIRNMADDSGISNMHDDE